MQKESITKKAILLFTTIQILYFSAINTWAIQSNKVVTGTKKLFEDAMGGLKIVGPTACALLAGYFFLRKGGADEQDQKMWQKRINTAIVAAVGIIVIASVIEAVLKYYK